MVNGRCLSAFTGYQGAVCPEGSKFLTAIDDSVCFDDDFNEYPIIKYICASGFEVCNNGCCLYENPIINYSCPNGYTLSGTNCTRTIIVDAKSN